MVTGDEEIKYGYLLDPCFQIVNTAGKPLTSGWIEVYIAGTRNKYYCSSDFAGTLHPFKIPLDSLGSNIILADVEKSYDVYVYNKFGNLAMSRYNITPGKGGAGGSISGSGIAEHWIGKNGQNRSIPAGTDTALKLPTSFEYEGSFIDRINENRTAFYLKEGLYLVQAVVNFKQSDEDLTNEISQVDVFTRSDDAPEDMSFNRDMAGPDSSDDSHCLKVSFLRCVKEDDEVSQIVLFKVNTPNAWSECYLQNVQIARLSSGGAGTGGQTYYAGEYITIDEETNTISVTGIDPDAYATHDELESATSGFITSADLEGYATEQWVLDKHYITSADIPDIPDDLVTSAELAQTSGLIEQDIADLTSAISESLSEKMDKSSSADFYPRYDNPEGYLTSIPSEYVTESEMSAYVNEQTSGFLTSADLPDVSDMATQTWVTEQHYITSADVPPQIEYSAGDNIDITDHVVSVSDTSQLLAGENVSITASGNDYIISAQVPETSGYVTEQEMNDAIQSATSAFLTSADIPPLPDDLVTSGELATVSGEIVNQIPSLDGYATEQYVTEQTSAFITSADLPDVSDMATKTWVGEQGYLTSIPSEYVTSGDLSSYVTETEMEAELSGKADTSAIPDVSNFVTQEDIDASVSGKMDASESSAFYPMATNPSGYLTSADVDMSAYIPYSAAGVDLPNSHFNIDASGQAYKNSSEDQALAVEVWRGTIGFPYPEAAVTMGDIVEVRTTVPEAVYIDGIPTSEGRATFVNGVARFTAEYSYTYGFMTTVLDANESRVGSVDSTNTEVVIVTESSEKYALESYVDSAVSGKQDKLTFGYNEQSAISAINGSALAGGSSFDPSVLDAYIPYSAAGVDLPNSKFRIDTSGQAYKIEDATHDVSISISSNGSVVPQETLTPGTYELTTSATDADSIDCRDPWMWVILVNGKAHFTLDSSYPANNVIIKILDSNGEPVTDADATNTTLVKSTQEQTEYLTTSDISGYATESYVDSAVSGKQDQLSFEYNGESAISAINGSALAGGGSFDPSVLDAYIPYSAAGVDLPNSKFRIDTSGQAYKMLSLDSEASISFDGTGWIIVSDYIDRGKEVEVRTTLQNARYIVRGIGEGTEFVNGVAKFTMPYGGSGTVLQIGDSDFNTITTVDSSNTEVVILGSSVKYATVSDVSGYATKSYVTSAVSGKQDALTFGYDESDKINAINGSAIAGGGGGGGSYTAGEFIDITNDVISVDSGDVSNLIPGDGILITQTSAGTKISYDPEELPGLYNTVLWDGVSSGSYPTFDLSGNISDFEYIEFFAKDEDGWVGSNKTESKYFTSANHIVIPIHHYGIGTKLFVTRCVQLLPTSDSSISGTVFGFDYNSNAGVNDRASITKIVGIGRKES